MLVNASKASIARTKCVGAAAAQRNKAASKNVKPCVMCEVPQRRECFSQRMLEGVADQRRKCKRCLDSAKLERGKWKCVE
eukprot:5343684-Pyramimonas_sp.AAC.1